MKPTPRRWLRSLIRSISGLLLIRAARRRRLQKLRFRVQCLHRELLHAKDSIQCLQEQLTGYRDAFHSIQTEYNLRGVAADLDIKRLTAPR